MLKLFFSKHFDFNFINVRLNSSVPWSPVHHRRCRTGPAHKLHLPTPSVRSCSRPLPTAAGSSHWRTNEKVRLFSSPYRVWKQQIDRLTEQERPGSGRSEPGSNWSLWGKLVCCWYGNKSWDLESRGSAPGPVPLYGNKPAAQILITRLWKTQNNSWNYFTNKNMDAESLLF